MSSSRVVETKVGESTLAKRVFLHTPGTTGASTLREEEIEPLPKVEFRWASEQGSTRLGGDLP